MHAHLGVHVARDGNTALGAPVAQLPRGREPADGDDVDAEHVDGALAHQRAQHARVGDLVADRDCEPCFAANPRAASDVFRQQRILEPGEFNLSPGANLGERGVCVAPAEADVDDEPARRRQPAVRALE